MKDGFIRCNIQLGELYLYDHKDQFLEVTKSTYFAGSFAREIEGEHFTVLLEGDDFESARRLFESALLPQTLTGIASQTLSPHAVVPLSAVNTLARPTRHRRFQSPMISGPDSRQQSRHFANQSESDTVVSKILHELQEKSSRAQHNLQAAKPDENTVSTYFADLKALQGRQAAVDTEKRRNEDKQARLAEEKAKLDILCQRIIDDYGNVESDDDWE